MEVDSHLVNAPEDIIMKEIKKKQMKNGSPRFSDNWRAVLSELVSTMSLLFFGCMTCIPIDGLPMNPPLYGTIGFGLVVLMNIQTFGHISGAHMNPAVTLAAVMWGKMSLSLGTAYFVAQCAGAVIGYGILIELSPVDMSSGICATQPHAKHTVYQALAVEILLTVALVLIICAVWDPVNKNKDESNSIKLGLTIAALSIAGGPLTGASMNPVRSLAPALWTNTWNSHWIYWAGPFLGAAVAVLFYKYVWLRVKRVKEPEILTDWQSKD
ncbi:aquaporin-like [Nymphalis io]|uniref:aquaporin-like n=1 Tax=Inachis io TaxID=171585 RepID=UPI002169A585|nr:aquaporin-like [Nymphalis io]